jgi:iron complex transport system substrate-binding protein
VGTGITQSQIIDKLEEVGLPVVALLPKDVSGVISDITLTGKITGEEAAANDLANKMNTKIQEISDKTEDLQKPSVYLEYYFNGGYYSWGSGGLVNELISIAGGTNVFESFSDEYVTTSSEEVISANPDIIIITNGAMAEAAGLTPDVIKTRTGWDSISAVKNNNIFEVDESSLTRAGPRILDALDELSEIFHPELFS